jgi:integrase/recombinase XerD
MAKVNLQPGPRRWLESSVFQPFTEGYLKHLARGRYTADTKRVYFCCIAHFACWISRERLALNEINEGVRERFITEHIPICDCPYPVRRVPHEIRAAISHLLTVLRAVDAIPNAGTQDERSRELASFETYMSDVAGLAINTRRQRLRIIGRFLLEQFGSNKFAIARIDAFTMRCFVLGEQRNWSAGTFGVVGGAIGSYLKFRGMSGDKVSHLIDAIPRVAHWRLTGVPDVLSNAQINELLASFDQKIPSRRRALAMVRCLVDLGLRCDEVVKLQLGDIDWRQGTLRVSGSKGLHTDILPLPVLTGQAIAEYLQHERPETSNRSIFVRHKAPYEVPIQKGVAIRAVIAAYQRCGWTRTNVHVLRHSVASRLLCEGTPLKHIADILRHRSLDTSMIYTKIDLEPPRVYRRDKHLVKWTYYDR